MYTMTQHIEERARQKGREDGKKEGKKEGRNERDIEYIVNMYQKGYTLAQIADVSEKTIKEVESILKDKNSLPA